MEKSIFFRQNMDPKMAIIYASNSRNLPPHLWFARNHMISLLMQSRLLNAYFYYKEYLFIRNEKKKRTQMFLYQEDAIAVLCTTAM